MTFYSQGHPHTERAMAGLHGFSLSDIIARLVAWVEARRAIAALERLSDRELADIGLARRDIHSAVTGQR
ncbi:MAG: DUF1127 domain-containing protein [Roseinatronobacter sp.]